MEKKKIDILHLGYLIFSFIIPCALLLWNCVVKSLLKNDITITQKLGVSGIFALIVVVLVAVILYGKHFKQAIKKIDKELLECLDNEQKAKLVDKKKKLEARQEIFGNACFVAPVLILWLLVSCVEKGIMSLRGELFALSILVCIGFAFNIIDNIKKTK